MKTTFRLKSFLAFSRPSLSQSFGTLTVGIELAPRAAVKTDPHLMRPNSPKGLTLLLHCWAFHLNSFMIGFHAKHSSLKKIKIRRLKTTHGFHWTFTTPRKETAWYSLNIRGSQKSNLVYSMRNDLHMSPSQFYLYLWCMIVCESPLL